MADRALTPVIDQFGSSFKLNAVDIRTVAIAEPKVMATIGSINASIGITTGVGGHTLDSGVRIKAKTNEIDVSVVGATAAGDGFHLAEGDEVFIETNQLEKIRVKKGGSSNGTVTFIAI